MTNPVINKAFSTLDVLSKDKKARAQYEQRLKSIRDRNSILDGAREEGELKGKLECKLEGKPEGILEGEMKGKLEVARNALKEGLQIEVVAKIAGLSIETITTLVKDSVK